MCSGLSGLPDCQQAHRRVLFVSTSPSYGIDVVALALVAVLAAAIVFLLVQIVPQLADLMMMPPPLSGG